jgi:thioredoxin reductase (NADPH)
VSQDARDLIIIGSGPAGYTAAVYAARANLRPLVFEGISAGGALMTTTDVENFPGFPDGILGPELMDGMRKQAERFGAELLPDDVTAVELTGPEKIVRVDADEFRSRAVIVASGSQWRTLGLPDEQRLLGHGVSAAPRATASSSAARTSRLSAEATRRWRRRRSSPSSPRRSR